MERPARGRGSPTRSGAKLARAELELIQAVQNYLASRRGRCPPDPGLEAAWDLFYQRYNPLVVRTILGFAPGAQDLDDCIQASWLHIVANLEKFRCHRRSKGRFDNWLRILVRRVLLDRARRGRITQHLTPVEAANLPGRDEDPATRQERDDRLRTIHGMLTRVRPRISPCSYRILHLRWFEGRPLDEIATLLGISPAQVRFRHHRVLRRLRGLLEPRADRLRSLL